MASQNRTLIYLKRNTGNGGLPPLHLFFAYYTNWSRIPPLISVFSLTVSRNACSFLLLSYILLSSILSVGLRVSHFLALSLSILRLSLFSHRLINFFKTFNWVLMPVSLILSDGLNPAAAVKDNIISVVFTLLL